MPSKSIFRQPGAQHFQLVHRSKRDPLIHDPDSSPHVLKPFERENAKKGKSRVEPEVIPTDSDSEHANHSNIGEASLYGVFFNDTDYDYMQHLRPIGVDEDGVESILIEASSSIERQKAKTKGNREISLRGLSSDVLPSFVELPRDYESEEAIPSSIAGFQPDMDPHLRQVLEALEEDAFVDDELSDNFFQELVVGGERPPDDDVDFEFQEGIGADPGGSNAEGEEVPDTWGARFERFKQEQKNSKHIDDSDSDVDAQSEDKDTISGLPVLSVIGGKSRRRKGTSDASGYSMSSSSLYRTESLKNLDEHFDQMMLREYPDDLDDDADEHASSDNSDTSPQLIASRGDFGSMIDDFLDNYEIVGGRMKPNLKTGAERHGILRTTMDRDGVSIKSEEGDQEVSLIRFEDVEERDRWDCETILTTYSNLENHPRLIRARDIGIVKRIRINPKTGFPITQPDLNDANTDAGTKNDNECLRLTRTTITRPRGETKEERMIRKRLVKVERQCRRTHKKGIKDQFTAEFKQQKKVVVNTEKPKMRKL